MTKILLYYGKYFTERELLVTEHICGFEYKEILA
jgi:hypothetical protein